MSAPARLGDFEGAWVFERKITDRRGENSGRVEGRAVFEPARAGLDYTETGQMRIGQGAPITATRRYRWQPGGAGRIAVFFEDGRDFHAFALSAVPEATHYCAPDTYRVMYDFSDWPRWGATWRVQGPAKDYEMTTRYAPAP